MNTDPRYYGLPSRVILESKSDTMLAICIRRKSRFVMKDAEAFWEKAKIIQNKAKVLPVLLLTPPLCSKAKKWLNDHGVTIIEE